MTTIRPVRPEEHVAVHGVVAAAFGEEQVADLVDALRAAGRVEVELVAVDDGEVVGHVGLERCWVDDEERLVEALTLSPLSVGPDHQGAGTGGALVGAALAAARERGEAYVFLEGAPGYYARHGFGPAPRPRVRAALGPDPVAGVPGRGPRRPWRAGPDGLSRRLLGARRRRAAWGDARVRPAAAGGVTGGRQPKSSATKR
ncbi:hypothetical protein GCM10009623_37060 [Nocardioides aestuarii]|uniref:GNAT family N-acetyltransferase n=1 Tax=Nocardioides aestuarii TaxID=252231 RepID=A0ABW4TR35_9ACTN